MYCEFKYILFYSLSLSLSPPPLAHSTTQDSVIYPRLVADEPYADETERQLEYFAVDGLRTLCIAQATIDKTYYDVHETTIHYNICGAYVHMYCITCYGNHYRLYL